MMNTIEYYESLEYEIVTRKVPKKDGGGFFAYYKDFKGIMGDGKTPKDAVEDAKSAFTSYLKVELAEGREIPLPSYLKKTKRINISIPVGILQKIDDHVTAIGTTRSAFLLDCAKKEIKCD